MVRRACCEKEGLKKGAWTATEDKVLIDYINVYGEGQWRNLSKRAGLKRSGKSCRLRWLNYLRPDIKRGNITPDEEDLIIRLHSLLGNRWSLIAGRLPGRTDNEIKNYWNTMTAKKSTSPNRQYSREKSTSRSIQGSSNDDHDKQQPITTGQSSVVRTKALKCTRVFTARDSQQTHHAKPEMFDEGIVKDTAWSGENDDDPSDLMMDFDMDDKFVSDFLNTEFEPFVGANQNEENSSAEELGIGSLASLLVFDVEWFQD